MDFNKEYLCLDVYDWKADPGQVIMGEPTRRAFDRYNGNQVLLLINYYASMNEGFSIEKGRIIEEKLIGEMPTDIRSEISAYNWLSQHIVFDETPIQ